MPSSFSRWSLISSLNRGAAVLEHPFSVGRESLLVRALQRLVRLPTERRQLLFRRLLGRRGADAHARTLDVVEAQDERPCGGLRLGRRRFFGRRGGRLRHGHAGEPKKEYGGGRFPVHAPPAAAPALPRVVRLVRS